MAWPKQRTPPNKVRTSKAPYNFIPLPEATWLPEVETKPFEQHDRLLGDRRHGEISVTITTETTTYTRCAFPPSEATREVNESDARQEFYHHGEPGRPVIPGSTLRGMIRSLVEILSSSRITRREAPGKATRILDERLVYRGVADLQSGPGRSYNDRFMPQVGAGYPPVMEYPGPGVQAGYLKKQGASWFILPAKRPGGTSIVRVPHALVNAAGITLADNKTTHVWIQAGPVAGHPIGNGRQLRYAEALQLQAVAGAGFDEAVLVRSGRMHTKRSDVAVYVVDPGATPVEIDPGIWEQFVQDRDMQRGISNRKLRDGDACFYLMEGGALVFLGPVVFFRVPYLKYTGDFVPPSLVQGGGLDLAEAIFGVVNPGRRTMETPDGGPHRGRVFVDDAAWEPGIHTNPFLSDDGQADTFQAPPPGGHEGLIVGRPANGDIRVRLGENDERPVPQACFPHEPWTGDPQRVLEVGRKVRVYFNNNHQITKVLPVNSLVLGGGRRSPAILSTPKPTSYQHYLVQTSRNERKADVVGYEAATPNVTVLRGHKRYWHRGEPEGQDLSRVRPGEESTQRTVIRPVRPQMTFHGRVRFENLTDLELGALLAALELPDGCRHQLGMGKPYGLGTVKLEVSVTLRNPHARYASLGATGALNETERDEVLKSAREAFRAGAVGHHNASSTRQEKVDPATGLWALPRLATLKTMLDWAQRPARENTACEADPGVFRERKVLPRPEDV